MHRAVNKYFFKHWSRDMAYVLGFFAADGYMWKSGRGAYFFGFQINDKKLLENIRTALCSTHKIAKRNRRNKKPQWGESYRLQIGSVEMYEDLLHLGMTPIKSNTLKFPKIPQQYFGDFIRGYFDGDGCVYYARLKFSDRKKPRRILNTQFISGSSVFLSTLHKQLKIHGIVGGTIRKKNAGFDLSLSFHDSLALYRIMYDTIPITSLFLHRKYKIFRKAIKGMYPHAGVA